MNTNEQAPDSCPFCGAEVSVHNGHKRSNGEYAVYRCGTWIDVTLKNKIGSRAVDCWTAERERLTRERDEAKKAAETAMVELGQVASSRRDLLTRIQRLEAAHTNALNQIGDLCMENANLLARVKRLESEWAGWPDLQREWFGGKYAAMQPLEAVRARIEDTEARVKRLEEAGDAMAADDQCHPHLMEQWEEAKEATP